MKMAVYFFLLGFFGAALASDPYASYQQNNENYYRLLADIEIVKDKSRAQLDREKAFKNLSDYMQAGPDGGWVTIKDGFLEILIADTEFFFAQSTPFPQAYRAWIEKLGLNWIPKRETRYPEMKSLAIKALKESIQTSERALEMRKETLKKLQSIEPKVVD